MIRSARMLWVERKKMENKRSKKIKIPVCEMALRWDVALMDCDKQSCLSENARR